MSNESRRQANLGARRAVAFGECQSCVLVYDALVEFDGIDNRVWPSLALLMEVTGLGRDAVRSALVDLQGAGLIEDTRDRAGRTGRVVIWRIVPLKAESLRERLKSYDYTIRKRRPLSNRLTNPKVAGTARYRAEEPPDSRPAPDFARDEEEAE